MVLNRRPKRARRNEGGNSAGTSPIRIKDRGGGETRELSGKGQGTQRACRCALMRKGRSRLEEKASVRCKTPRGIATGEGSGGYGTLERLQSRIRFHEEG